MWRIFLVIFSLFITAPFQGMSQDMPNATTSSAWTLGYGQLHLLDEYLSPLVYTGSVFRADYQSMHYMSLQTTHVSLDWTLSASIGLEHNPAGTNSIFYCALQPGVGVHYHFRPAPNLKILVGGVWDVFFANKYSFENGNNPYSADLSTRLNVSAIAQYDWHIGKLPVVIRYSLTVPTLGLMFVPQYGASYYEMFTLGNMAHTIHFTTFNNYLAMDNALSADFVLRRWIVRAAYYYDYDKHNANSLHFETMQSVFSIGAVVNFAVFDHGKRKVPSNYHDINQ
jgi:hypothetical protein